MHGDPRNVVVMSDGLGGGAATATNRLADGLAAIPLAFERWHFSPDRRPANPPWEIGLDPCRKRPPFERVIKNVSLVLANRLRRRRHTQAFLAKVLRVRPALLNVHNIHNCGLNHESLRKLPKETPLVWTLHDCWPFRAEAFRWENSQRQCSETVCVDEPVEHARQRREQFFQARPDIVFAAPSKWIAAEALQAVPATIRIEHIPYGVDLLQFSPLPPGEARRALALAPERNWLGYSSTWASTRKGADVLWAALHKMDCRQLGLLLWGEEPSFDWPAALEVKKLGPVKTEAALGPLYSACDLFVCPSRADNLPNAVLESLACGTPVVGSRVGGIPDMVRPGETGWLFKGDRPENCAGALAEALAAKADWPRYRRASRQVAEQEYGVALQAERYAKLFQELLVQTGAPPH